MNVIGLRPIKPNGSLRTYTLGLLSTLKQADGGGGRRQTADCRKMNGSRRKYSCKTVSETLEWIHAIIGFIKPYRFLIDAQVVNFFGDKLWEAVDSDWMDCLRNEPVENLLRIPSGAIQDHWPASLKEFVLTLKSLSFPRAQANLQEEFPGLTVCSLSSVLAQGMNRKKKHEIESLAAIVSSIAKQVVSSTVVDVGAGQGYLAQVLSFQYALSVFAIDACLHHGKITDARAERIRKHYAAKMRKSESKDRELCVPQTVTCRVLSTDSLKNLNDSLSQKESIKASHININRDEVHSTKGTDEGDSGCNSSLVLAGLHACGDLSVTMLRTFLECEKVKSVISIGCCYNLLSEDSDDAMSSLCGFPMSNGIKSAGLELGRNARDLACQSAERWRSLGEEAGLHNFELHAFRAAFQLVLARYNPELLTKKPSVGRQGKALRRQQNQKILESSLHKENCPSSDFDGIFSESSYLRGCLVEKGGSVNRFSLFMKFCRLGLDRLGLHQLEDIDFHELWEETEPFAGWIGPYWTLRAALGPVLETLILLDRLLFLQEQGSVLEAVMLPIFDPVLSPRNVALIAKKN